MNKVLTMLAALALSACQTAMTEDQRIAQDDTKCLSYGVPRGSPVYIQCRMNIDRGRADIAASERFGQGSWRGVVPMIMEGSQSKQ